MSQKTSNVKPQAKEGDNIFDTYFTYIEKIKLGDKNKNKELAYEYLSNSVTILERDLIDISQNKSIKSSALKLKNESVNQILSAWFPVLEVLSSDSAFITGLSYNFFGASLIINNTELGEEDIKSLTSYFKPSFEYNKIIYTQEDRDYDIAEELNYALKNLSENPRDLQLLKIYRKVRELTRHFEFYDPGSSQITKLIFKLVHQLESQSFSFSVKMLGQEVNLESIRERSKQLDIIPLLENYFLNCEGKLYYEWLFRIKTSEDSPDANRFINLINTFITAIKLIDEEYIDIELSDWGNGSKWAEFKIKFKSFLSKEETKQILDKVSRAAEAELFDKRIGEADKLYAEAKKTNKEAENLMEKNEAEEMNRLEVQLKRLSVFEKEVDIQQKIEDLKAKKIDNLNRISEMIKNEVVLIDSSFRIEINGLLYLNKGDGTFKIGENMDVIDGQGLINPSKTEND